MDFSTCLNGYIAEIGCSAKELSEVSGVSSAAISRYRGGERLPDPDGHQIQLLAHGIATLSHGSLNEDEVHNELATCVSGISVDYGTFLLNLNALLDATAINNIELARTLSFDASYISRILAGQRRPADLRTFVAGVSGFIARRCAQPDNAAKVGALMNVSAYDLEEQDQAASMIGTWLGTNFIPIQDPVGNFLEKLDAFDLDDFIQAIHFDEMKVPTSPLQLPTTKTYTGLKQMMECELDFLKATVFSKSNDDVIMYSDMPIVEMSSDPSFPKKWMYGMAMLLKKGLHLNIVHDTNRPLHEMMLGLESWIPMYMTGLISPYYLDESQGGVFNHLLKVSGTAAMQGEAISGFQNEGRYVLTKNRDEVRYYRKRAERLMEKSRPLMRIITKLNAFELDDFLEDASCNDVTASQRMIMSTLPLGAIPPDVLEAMLDRCGITGRRRVDVDKLVNSSAKRLRASLANRVNEIEVPSIDSIDFSKHPPTLELEGIFVDFDVPYLREDYEKHLVALRQLVSEHPESRLVETRRSAFRNIQILVTDGCSALVSKSKSPTIHFVITHRAIIDALMRFTPPVKE